MTTNEITKYIFLILKQNDQSILSKGKIFFIAQHNLLC